jgi:hypothetical protein
MNKTILLLLTTIIFACTIEAQADSNRDKISKNLVNNYSQAIALFSQIKSFGNKEFNDQKEQTNNNIAATLSQNFTSDELNKIESDLQVIAPNLDTVLLSAIQLSTTILTLSTLDDANLNISQNYTSLINNEIAKHRTYDSLYNYYLSKNPNLVKEANGFALKATNNIRNFIASNFTEQQFFAYMNFSNSPLGKKFIPIVFQYTGN